MDPVYPGNRNGFPEIKKNSCQCHQEKDRNEEPDSPEMFLLHG